MVVLRDFGRREAEKLVTDRENYRSNNFAALSFLHDIIFMTVDKVEHLLKLADEYQTKSVFNVCVNLLKNEVAGSKEKAMSILYLANTTDMARTDERLDVVRKECYDYIKDMALQKIMEKEDFKNLEQDVRENVLVKRIEKIRGACQKSTSSV